MTLNVIDIASFPVNNVWISASAGSGKTKVLIDRVLRLLLSNTDPAKILCLTYTKAAAAEMTQRITAELSKWVMLGEEQLYAEIETLIGEKPRAETIDLARGLLVKIIDQEHSINMQTIHSFCQSIIAKFPIESGLGLQSKIIDDNQRSKLLRSVKLHFLKECNANADILETVALLLTNTHEFSLDVMINAAIEFRHKILQRLEEDAECFSYYQQQPDNDFEKFNYKFTEIVSNHINILRDLVSNEECSLTRAVLEYQTISNKEGAFEQLYDLFYTQGHSLRKTLISTKNISKYKLEEFVSDIRICMMEYVESRNKIKVKTYSEAFVKLVLLIDKHYKQLKRSENLLDYDDLIKTVTKLLDSEQLLEWIMFKLDENIEHILVDESQDISLEQWKIISILTRDFFCEIKTDGKPRTIFIVGDQKQSIFSFQGADPKLFNELNQYFGAYIQSFSGKLHNIELAKSYRSGSAILQLVDEVFSQLIKEQPDKYIGDYVKHTAHKSIASKVEIWPPVMQKKATKKEDYEWDIHTEKMTTYNPSQILAKILAVKIKSILPEVNARDILILIRKRDKFTEDLINELKDNNIPVSGLDRIHLNKNLAIMDLISIANFILLPSDDYNLACLLKSPLVGITEDKLLSLTLAKGKTLLEKLLSLADKDDFAGYAKTISQISNFHASSSPYQLYSEIVNVRGYRKKLVSVFGPQINEILDEFLNCCLDYEEKESSSLQGFIEWFVNSDLVVKRETDNVADAVRIMTVHASKGLQARCVILADTMSVPRFSERVLWSDELNVPLYNGSSKYNDEAYNKAKSESITQVMQEYYRLLYVAMTRAIDQLIICGYSSNLYVQENSWYSLVAKAMKTLGREQECLNLMGFDILTDSADGKRDEVFYSDRVVKYIYENKGQAHNMNLIEECIQSEELPVFLFETLTTTNIKQQPVTSDRSLSPLETRENSEYGTEMHKSLELAIKNNIEQELVVKIKSMFSSEAKYMSEISIGTAEMLGVIDLLVIDGEKLAIIDYKTKKFNKAEEVDRAYVMQLTRYRDLVSEIYPGKEINCYIASVSNSVIFEIVLP